jgi:hypothetical protein
MTKSTRIAGAVALALCALIGFACDDDTQAPPTTNGPPAVGLTDPIWEYGRSEGQSITGGYVYHGAGVPSLVGKYVYADHSSGNVWALSYDGATATNEFLFDPGNGLSAFGVAENGELFVCRYNSVNLTRIGGIMESGGNYSLTDPFPNLSFNKPVDLRNAGDGSNRLFVVEQEGYIRVFDNNASEDSLKEFLDISGPVECCGELGLLGLVFHPNYVTNGYFFVFYTTTGGSPHRDRLSRFQVSADPDDADESTEKILFELSDDFGNHNGGGLCFGDDGYLYVSTGDEGAGGDPDNNAQDRTRMFGKILRLDVDQNINTIPYYGIPPDNPLVANTKGYREEIYAWGFRNPWRISFDSATDRLWVADVGQDRYEEIDVVEKGKNYGWDCREGKHDYVGPPDGPSPLCDP